MNGLERLGRVWSTSRCVAVLAFALLIIVSHPCEALAAVAAPASLAVTSTSNAQISVNWAASAGAARYQVERASSSAGPYTVVGTPTTNSFADGAVVAGTTYIYRVRALDSGGNLSPSSNIVVATAVTYTDAALTPGVTPLKAVHMTELRQTVNSVRRAAALPDAAWTDANLVGATVRGVHVQEMRDSLNQALAALHASVPAYTDPTLATGAAGTPIKAVHIEELRRYAASAMTSYVPPPDDNALTTAACPAPQSWPSATDTVVANVVALDQVLVYNRLGAVNPSGMIFALERDVVAIQGTTPGPGNAQLRPGKRPRPLTLRVNAGQKLQINFKNWLAPTEKDDQPHTRSASIHVEGLQPVGSISDDGSNVGQNPSSLVAPGGSATYTLYAEHEGNHLLYSTAATTGGEGDGGSIAMGLFGSVNVEPKGAEWYRSQVTAAELKYATKLNADGTLARTTGGQPLICYDAVYPAGHSRAGQPVLRMVNGGEIVHSDLNAVITGSGHGRFPAGTYRVNAVYPDRDQPFREFTVVYHDEVQAVQAFPKFYDDPVLGHTLHSVGDKFAINYGIAGIGSEILANRLGVGPMANCVDCNYEEFFLSAWTVGDPAEVVDVPANSTNPDGSLKTGLKATKVLYPDDPSNVHHSYIGDHVKMRVVHAGPKEHHIHHLHAHQWLHTPDDDNSSYLDSQAMGPGYAFTTEIAHGGSGNRNQTVGDSIFHCHFYPHFAQGMWELWRSHDVFEAGTALDVDGRPAPGSRALPDGEIAAGTPIPAIVPMPTLAMAPMPEAQVQIVGGQAQITGTGNPGYPFFVAAVAGHRPPHPPLDTVDEGGLPRHVITGGTFTEVHTRLDFSKDLVTAVAEQRQETGTPTEVAAMNYHAQRVHPSFTPDGTAANYILNGLPAQPGAPFADPCMDDSGRATGTPRLYKAADIQLDLKLNKAGWHYPQARILTLWSDVAATRAGTRAPEPFFFRANTGDCITYYHTNLVPRNYELDDFQVRTPTDIMGQHIHLVKFDVTSSDGAGNGWNYEDGTFSPEEVISRIRAIRRQNACAGQDSGDTRDGTFTCPVARAHPTLGTLGAQTTVQRWYADDTLNNNGKDRTLRTVFTHDHFGPSTHQQTGLYGGLVVEPKGSQWRDQDTGTIFGGAGVTPRADGGPTTWRADILTGASGADSYREYLLEFADYQLAYEAGGGVDAAGKVVPDPARAISPPVKDEVGLPFIVQKAQVCPGGVPLPCPEAVSSADPGTMSVNYRNEPAALRVRDPNTNTQAAGDAGDLSNVYRSDVMRADTRLNSQPTFYPALTPDVQGGDPFTPLLRAYENDPVQIRILVGAHEEGHNFSVHGVKWKFEPGTPEDPASVNNSGYRNNQMMGISEHYEFVVPRLPRKYDGKFADYLYTPGASVDDQWNGLWGLMRVFVQRKADLTELPNNVKKNTLGFSNKGDFSGVCPKTANVQPFDISAVRAKDVLPGGTLVYNSRQDNGGALHDPTAILFVRTTDIDAATGKLKAGVPIEPLVLRAKAGDCINVTLNNKLPAAGALDLDGFNTMPMIVEHFNANQVRPSSQVGLHAQNLFYDVTRSDGMNVGVNPVQTVKPGFSTTYQWYAGDVTADYATDNAVATPIE
ncbi:MAG: manganese oxidase, partial [Acidobacteriota bacterium]|nr:manganese oxidase [Acidobacteriota bacterium]